MLNLTAYLTRYCAKLALVTTWPFSCRGYAVKVIGWYGDTRWSSFQSRVYSCRSLRLKYPPPSFFGQQSSHSWRDSRLGFSGKGYPSEQRISWWWAARFSYFLLCFPKALGSHLAQVLIHIMVARSRWTNGCDPLGTLAKAKTLGRSQSLKL